MKINCRLAWAVMAMALTIVPGARMVGQDSKIVDTGQQECYDTIGPISPPLPGEPFYGQDAQHEGNQPSYLENGDGTVTDLMTGLVWQKNLYPEKFTYDQAVAGADTCSVGGYSDWRLPSIKELFSLIDFRGLTSVSAQTSIPFIDTSFFEFRYGDESAGERFIDAQYASGTEYIGTTMNGSFTIFGVNFADGRIKGYGTVMPFREEKKFEVRYVRGSLNYGMNDFTDNGDGTITDAATDLMWTKDDSGAGMNWEDALAWVQQKNEENFQGYSDWHLPDAKELQSIVDYTRCPQITGSPAIDPVFNVTPIIDEGGGVNYPFYWTSTTHADGPPDLQYIKAVYVSFGEALGFMEMPPNSGNYILMDVHGAGAQRSDPKSGDPENFPHGFGPQGDVIRIFNYVRMVRDASQSSGTDNTGSGPVWMKVYPNPAAGEITVKMSKRNKDLLSIELMDPSGKSVFSTASDKDEHEIHTSGLQPGVYILNISDGKDHFSEKIIIL